ncbi:cadherin-related family member 3 isoform X2 [Bos indicus]|uniref:Cadherin-related family member 3 isoform X2 n=1 Tax=Bos indicus TaxID=9915 RepID=A0ABM4S7S1_BOSIN
MQEVVLFLLLLGVLSGGQALHLIHLPAMSKVAENSPPETSVHMFAMKLSASLSPVVPGFPLIINSSPLTRAFRVNWLSDTDFEVVTTGMEQLDFEEGPHIFDLQIYVKDDVAVTDLQVLTVQVTDVNEPPEFQGNLAKGLDLYIVEGTKPGFVYQVEAFDPEDTSQNLPLSYLLISPSKNFRMSANGTLLSTTEFDFEAGHSSYHLIVEVRDSQGLGASTELHVNIVNINDEIPRFTNLTHMYTIPEELSPGIIVAHITAEDPDDRGFTSFLLYSITTVNSYFMINQLTGAIQVARRIDRDAGELRQNPIISLEVLVKDRPSGGQENRKQITFTVEDINDNPSTCTKFIFSIMVPERAARGTSLLDLNKFCFDDDSEAPNNRFNFTTPSGVGRGSRFLQDPAGSGKIVVTVNIIEENDEKPICTPNSYFLAIPVDLKVGTNIHNFKLTCTDLDSSPRSFRYSIGAGNINSHFTFSPNAGSNVTSLILATRFDYASGLDKIWNYKLLVYITNDNLLSGRKRAGALVETGTVTLSISVIPHPTTIITTTPKPRITYQILRKNVYSPSAWYVPFVITLGSMLLLGLLVSMIVLLAKAIHRHCPCKTEKHKKTLNEEHKERGHGEGRGDPLSPGSYCDATQRLRTMYNEIHRLNKSIPKTVKSEASEQIKWMKAIPSLFTAGSCGQETMQMNTVFDGEATDPVTGAIYEFNSKTGARKWKDSLTQMPKWKESSPQGAAPRRPVPQEGTRTPRSTDKERDGLSIKVQAEDAGLGPRSQDSMPSTPKNRNSAFTRGASPKRHPEK